MPDEILALIIIFFGLVFILSLVSSVSKHQLKKLEHKRVVGSDDTLTTTELQRMIEDAVAKATAPMGDDLELLAARMDQIEGTGGRILLEEGDDVQEKTLGRSVRQREG